MECYSDFGTLKQYGELNVSDDPKNIIGVTVDRETDNIIVTYPHIVQKYKLLNEEPHTCQTLEWRTKHHLTSGVVYDAFGGHYIAVYNRDTVRLSEEIDQFDTSDKYTFRISIYQILTRLNKTPVILFLNGDCITLSLGLQQCRTFSRRAVIKESSTIVEATSYTRDDTDYVCFIVKDKNSSYIILNYSLKDEICNYDDVKIVKVSEFRKKISKDQESSVNGCCIVAGATENPSVCVVWNDGYTGMYNVSKNSWKIKFHSLTIQKRHENKLLYLKRNLILFYGKNLDNSSYIKILFYEKSRYFWSRVLELGPYSKHTNAFLCGDHVVLVETSRITVWSITVHHKENVPRYLNNSEELMRQLEPEKYLPIFGPRKKQRPSHKKKVV